jgi:hypothetical protein
VADFIAFTEGRSELANNGLPATCYFLLSTKSVDGTSAHTANETLAGGTLGEITGTGYARQSQAEPTASNGVVTFTQMSWSTGAATDWPSTVRSVVLVTGAAGTGKAIAAWNLIAGGAARDLSQANTTEQTTPSLTVG